MRAVGRRNTPGELMLRKAIWRRGIRYRVHREIAGTLPDIILSRSRIAVFVDGCFWHGCPRHYSAPRRNAAFWRHKVEENKAKDRRHDAALRLNGWQVFRLWECELRSDLEAIVERLVRAAAGKSWESVV